jgi:beta-glucanase (GH16 family)
MRSTTTFLKIVLIVFGLRSYAFSQTPSIDTGFELVFNDEFNGTSINNLNWDRKPPWNQSTNVIQLCENGPIVPLAYRKWYSDANFNLPDTTNCKVNGGSVKLYTRKENYIGQVWNWPNGVWEISYLPFQYTTAMLYSKKKFRYGYFEIRFKIHSPTSPPPGHKNVGFGPNFWLFNADTDGNHGWINHWSELDIFEINSHHLPTSENNLYTNNVHYRSCPDESCHISQGADFGSIADDVWHTAGMNWNSNQIEFYLNGVKLRDFPCSELNLPPDSLIAMPIWVDVNAPTSNFCANFNLDPVNGSIFPYVYEIDYVKVWQLKKACNNVVNICNLNPMTFDSKIYKEITFGGFGCNSTVSHQLGFSAYATDYILLEEGFTIDTTSNALFDVVDCESQILNN